MSNDSQILRKKILTFFIIFTNYIFIILIRDKLLKLLWSMKQKFLLNLIISI